MFGSSPAHGSSRSSEDAWSIELGDVTEELEAAAVIHAGRHRPVDALVGALRARGFSAVAVGDARVPRLVEDAVRSGWEAASGL